MSLINGSLQLGLIYGLLALGIFITFRILNIPDLTADGSFTLGLAVSAVFTVSGQPVLGIFMAIIAGFLAGTLTGFLHTKMKIHPILSGIITMSGLYTVNLFILGARSNISLIGSSTIYTYILEIIPSLDINEVKTLLSLGICLISYVLLSWLFKTQLGLSIRATGENEDMLRASSVNVDRMKILAIGLANSFVALSGAVIAQYQGFADIGSGVGIMVTGLASVIIGEVFLSRRSISRGLFSAIIGSIAYRFIIALALNSSIFPAYALKLVSAIIVGIALSIPAIKDYSKMAKIRKAAEKDASY